MAFSLNYAFIIIIVCVSIFTILYAAMPTDFFINQSEYQTNLQSAEVQERFEALDMVTYSSFANDTMIYEYSSIFDAPDAPQWETAITDRYIEIWWGNEYIPDVGGIGKTFEVRDTEKRSFIIDYYVMLEYCPLYYENGTFATIFLQKSDFGSYGLENTMLLTAKGQYISASIVLRANGTDTINDGWDDGTLTYDITYEIDFEAMKPNAFMLIAKLITFQDPDFGIPGLFGTIVTGSIGIAMWCIIVLLAYTVITKLIPTIQGGLEN